ncbi:hypothetical protein PTSG_07425 [Salpingoeca rosetta]|uniref:Amino acid transporter transmembrane domain-containing protein n=1 Tax=Salpingoeca rosetta (strain ATCC 50818 / BSB-021) TaxID=946362 RepID=F2UIN7_SALR5|nr:uncharacterized protein PTSG_07425 [Salpingoeca rosetta]EGD77086.1 hypothetical protein PTSG_07425 [Salpingoeca rosetta]|eukprot:XP_004990925.1 hypothetical protein PTSG_07425 [Salpingoeca rosetta]
MAGAGDGGAGAGGQPLPFKEALFCFFVSIATILGTGILALPVKLYECGFGPFVVTFLFALLAQTGVVWLMVEILQRAEHRMAHSASGPQASPSLHSLAAMYLARPIRFVFNLSAMVHFVSLLIGYVLAWSKAFCQLAGCEDRVVITPFVIVFTAAIVIFNKQLQPLVTTLTFIKCVMLIVMVGVVGYIGSKADIDPSTSWPAMGSPFLIGTIALGGVVNVMPVLYERIPKSSTAIRQFRSSVTAGVAVCWALNILW